MLFGSTLHKATPILRYSERLQRLAPCGHGLGWCIAPQLGLWIRYTVQELLIRYGVDRL